MIKTPEDALALVETIVRRPGNKHYVRDTKRSTKAAGIVAAVAGHDTPALYRWLMDGFSFQGISDAVASGFIARYGNAEWETISESLTAESALCEKLGSFEAYRGCRYRKVAHSCGLPGNLPNCPVPQLRLRKGGLNEQAYSLFLFIRDRCDGDLVGFIDQVILHANDTAEPEAGGRECLLAAFSEVIGVSRKLVSMTLAMLLIGGGLDRPGWAAVGRSMVAVDTLVHNFLHRTGILAAYRLDHAYGPRCYGDRGCERVIRDLADWFDARSINRKYSPIFPRLVQHAIWRFCSQAGENLCNGRNIKAGAVCTLTQCPVFSSCSRLPLVLPPPAEAR